ncbi:hypothetical protein [Shewanella sp. DW31]|uniref:hypothetical protein n=1 Tax=Shewanella sp. DW31 TaxID=2699422 RepID=UPI0018E3D99D|nr:hypothetical protein [Shewanella sp. DW31]MBI1674324.1 hypothetical protein [Shewanella sp. DW31]
MSNYIINKNAQSNGDHEVHNTTTGCSYMPNAENQIDLGSHLTCSGAVLAARKTWPEAKINGCYYCCNPCHTS